MNVVEDIMTVKPICLKDNDSLFLGRTTMRNHGIRHIPIIYADSGYFAGILTQKSVLSKAIEITNKSGLHHLEEEEKKISIELVMDTDVTTVGPSTPLLKAALYFRDHRHGCLAVVSNDKVVGILTSGDFVKLSIHFLETYAKI
ncbi:CBS domain-containing protein [Pleionea sp. CnH1-48]|uniref:CBS domain-containing protein n=1 Tax=Pleionea sp. CnH1-48 TaxID=2954494 RepID=UPI0020969962|nr:CBS domain-containing protein [Pleionea sp. CnH1-48]MCO7223919.1 CBS domain-containing protein [Pleionea sp. CnH1-48]